MYGRPVIIAICLTIVVAIGWHISNPQYRTQLYHTLCQTPTRLSDDVRYNYKKISEENSFFRISQKYKTDKVSEHHYEVLYEKYLAKYVGSDLHLLEIGLGCGMPYGPGASAYVWRHYLGPLANIYFLEFNRACGEEWYKTHGSKLNITMFYGSQDNVAVLNNVTSRKGNFDVIIDDGGHTMDQQITSITNMLPKVHSGGVYVLEDLLTSYMAVYGGGYLRNTTTIELIKKLVDDVQAASPQKVTKLGSKIRSFEIANEICFFTVN